MAIISKLASSQYLTDKHWDKRNESQIKYIIPHHMAGIMTGAGCAKYFVNNGYDNSANYCIGYNGDISCNVPEQYGAWTSSWWRVDTKGITIEVSNSSNTDSDWPISNASKEALIRLMVDLFQRYPSLGGKAIFNPSDEYEVVAARAVNREPDPKGNILLHNWTDKGRKICPGPYMTKNMPQICKEVNRRLSGEKRTLHEQAQYMIDNNVNGAARKAQAISDGFKPQDVQAEIDKMLAKNKSNNIQICVKYLPNVKKGDKVDIVTILQQELKYMGYLTVAPDGIFGSYTDAALKAFQTNINKVYGNFTVDGICGPKTWTKILIG